MKITDWEYTKKSISLCIKIITMRTNIDLDDQLMQQALRLSRAKTKKEVVELALQSFVKNLQRQQLLALRGKVQWEGDLDAMRQI